MQMSKLLQPITGVRRVFPSRAVRIGSTAVQPVSVVRDLGIMLDAEVTISTQLCLCCRQSKFRDTATDP